MGVGVAAAGGATDGVATGIGDGAAMLGVGADTAADLVGGFSPELDRLPNSGFGLMSLGFCAWAKLFFPASNNICLECPSEGIVSELRGPPGELLLSVPLSGAFEPEVGTLGLTSRWDPTPPS